MLGSECLLHLFYEFLESRSHEELKNEFSFRLQMIFQDGFHIFQELEEPDCIDILGSRRIGCHIRLDEIHLLYSVLFKDVVDVLLISDICFVCKHSWHIELHILDVHSYYLVVADIVFLRLRRCILYPAARRASDIQDRLCVFVEEMKFLLDLFQLVSASGFVSFFLCLFEIVILIFEFEHDL